MEATVKVVKPSVGVREVKLEGMPSPTVGVILSQSGIDYEGCEVRLNNKPAELNDSVAAGDRVSILPRTQGN